MIDRVPTYASMKATKIAGDEEQLFEEVLSDIFEVKEILDRLSIRFGVFIDSGQLEDIEERFDRAKIAAERIKDDQHMIFGFYD